MALHAFHQYFVVFSGQWFFSAQCVDPLKKSKLEARFEPTTFCSTHKSPNHYTTAVVAAANHYFPRAFHRQTLETNPANHW